MASKIEQIRRLIDGQHCMGSDGLRDYHAARAVRDAKRYKGEMAQLAKVKHALNPYPVIACVVFDAQHETCIALRNTITGESLTI